MHLCLEDINNKYEKGEIYGSWNNWQKPLKISEYNYIFNNIKIFNIETDDVIISYKIKINNEYILLNNLLITYDNGFENNKIILTDDNYYYNGKIKIKFDQNDLFIIIYDVNNMYLCIDDKEYEKKYNNDNKNNWNNAEIYGSWDNWVHPIKITDYDFNIDNIKIFLIKTNDLIVSYKIKYNNNFILLKNIFTTIDNGFENNKIIVTHDNYIFNGIIKIKNINNKMIIFYDNNLLLDVETKNGIPNGNGNQYYRGNEKYFNIKLYEGEWLNGKFSGKGIYYRYNYIVYEGEWQNGLCHGKGIGFSDINKYYVGEWQNGFYHGQGTYYINNNKSYEGEWEYELYHGKGISYGNYNKKLYDGEFKKGMRHGYGISYDKDNKKSYEGEWQNGLKHGNGIDYYIFNKDIKCYEGEFIDGVYHGKGILYNEQNGSKLYEGEWTNGIRHDNKTINQI
jgi:hypothetical protein